jgi:O-antigen/teichoic acid export membrane protein
MTGEAMTGEAMTARARSGLMASLLRAWQQNKDLLRNAGSLAGTTGMTSIFGAVFWVIAAREFSQQAVGYGSAAVSAMQLLGTIGMFGLGTMLIGELPRRREKAGLVSATLAASALGSLVLGFGFPPVANAFGGHFPEISGTPARLVLFGVGVALTGATLVFDDATIGLMRGGVQLTRNFVMSLIKLLALPVVAVVLHDALGVGLVLAWVFGTLVSLGPAVIMLRRDGTRIFHRPDWGLLRRLGKVAIAHNWLNLAIQTPPRLYPVLVVLVVSPSANAAFYVAWMLSSFLLMVPASLSTVLFAVVSAAPEVIAEKLRFVLRLSVIIGLPAMIALGLSAHLVLSIFGAKYAQLATLPLWLLIIAYIPGLPKLQYISVCRATGRVGRAAIVMTAAACCEMAAVVLGGKFGGLIGLSAAYLGVTVVEALVTAPTVLRAAYARGEQRRAGNGTTAALPATAGAVALAAAVSEGRSLDVATEVWRTGSFPAAFTDSFLALAPGDGQLDYPSRQQAGLAALIAMATPVSPDASTRPHPSSTRPHPSAVARPARRGGPPA